MKKKRINWKQKSFFQVGRWSSVIERSCSDRSCSDRSCSDRKKLSEMWETVQPALVGLKTSDDHVFCDDSEVLDKCTILSNLHYYYFWVRIILTSVMKILISSEVWVVQRWRHINVILRSPDTASKSANWTEIFILRRKTLSWVYWQERTTLMPCGINANVVVWWTRGEQRWTGRNNWGISARRCNIWSGWWSWYTDRSAWFVLALKSSIDGYSM